ncbi:MAG: hypothetical protein JWN86_4647 [Planctomycetota bacterium]|nr:hypothetical protein [Planctomycetota bacterium]
MRLGGLRSDLSFGSRVLAILVAVSCFGCTGPTKPGGSMVPDVGTARKAIELAMASWKAGKPTGVIESGSPRIQVADSFRQPGQRLERYEILGEAQADKSRDVTVRAFCSNPETIAVIRYRVIGIDPVHVIREEDYQLMSHWEHKMTDETPPSELPHPTARK